MKAIDFIKEAQNAGVEMHEININTSDMRSDYEYATDFARDWYGCTTVSMHPKAKFASKATYAAVYVKIERTDYNFVLDFINKSDFIGNCDENTNIYFFKLS